MKRAASLHGIRACIFDAYGTLFDFASAVKTCDGVPEDQRSALTSLWREKQLDYTWLRSLQGLMSLSTRSRAMRSNSRSTRCLSMQRN